MSTSNRALGLLALSLLARAAARAQESTCKIEFGPPTYLTTDRGRFLEVEFPQVTIVGGDTLISGHYVIETDTNGVWRLTPTRESYYAGGFIRGSRFDPISMPKGVGQMGWPRVLREGDGTRWFWVPWDTLAFKPLTARLMTNAFHRGVWTPFDTTVLEVDWNGIEGSVGRVPAAMMALPANKPPVRVAVFRQGDVLSPSFRSERIYPAYERVVAIGDTLLIAGTEPGPAGNRLTLWRGGIDSSIALSREATEPAHHPMFISADGRRIFLVWFVMRKGDDLIAAAYTDDNGRRWTQLQPVPVVGSVTAFDAIAVSANAIHVAATVATTAGSELRVLSWRGGTWSKATVPGVAPIPGDRALAVSNAAFLSASASSMELLWNTTGERTMHSLPPRLVRSSGKSVCSRGPV